MTVYIVRHQEGNVHRNCLNRVGLKHCDNIYNKLKNKSPTYVFTCTPFTNGKHVRPLQTASIVASLLNINVILVPEESVIKKLPKMSNSNNIIVWHHTGMGKLLNCYYPGHHFEWDPDNYTGALIIGDDCWWFDKDFLLRKWFCF